MRLIDADKLKEELRVNGLGYQYYMLDNAPTVETEPVRHGHWVRNDNGTYSCSECHSWIPNEQHYYARYCLFCGAKMNEEKENEINR